MKFVVTGAAGFLGARVADALLTKPPFAKIVKQLILTDVNKPAARADPRVKVRVLDLTKPSAAEELIQEDCGVVFHLAAVVSGQAEAEFDLGMKSNLSATQLLLEAVQKKAPTAKFVFASSVAVFGGDLQPIANDLTAMMPQTSYGTAKAMCELLVNDYSRLGFVDGRSVRLPIVSVRAGAPNSAMSSFVSGIIREPLNGVEAICPVPPNQEMCISSPATVVHNIIHATTLDAKVFDKWRAVNLPVLCVSPGYMVAALRAVTNDKIASLVKFEYDETMSRLIATMPTKFDNSRALKLGFRVDSDFAEVIRFYIRNDLNQQKNKI